jgi:hypothetical protein
MLLILFLNTQILYVNAIFTNLVFKLQYVVIIIIWNTWPHWFIWWLFNCINCLRCLVLIIDIFIETLYGGFSRIQFVIKTEILIFIILNWALCNNINVLLIRIFGFILWRNYLLINNFINIGISSNGNLDFSERLWAIIKTISNWCQWLDRLMINILYILNII